MHALAYNWCRQIGRLMANWRSSRSRNTDLGHQDEHLGYRLDSVEKTLLSIGPMVESERQARVEWRPNPALPANLGHPSPGQFPRLEREFPRWARYLGGPWKFPVSCRAPGPVWPRYLASYPVPSDLEAAMAPECAECSVGCMLRISSATRLPPPKSSPLFHNI